MRIFPKLPTAFVKWILILAFVSSVPAHAVWRCPNLIVFFSNLLMRAPKTNEIVEPPQALHVESIAKLQTGQAKIDAVTTSFRKILAATDPVAWEQEVGFYVELLENIAGDSVQALAFAADPIYEEIVSSGGDIRSREMRNIHGLMGTGYDLPGRGEPPFLDLYNARLKRIEAALSRLTVLSE